MRVIYKLWIILIFVGVITAQAGPTLSVTLDKTAPYDGATRKNETISTKARVQSYTNDNLQEELDQGGYVEYKYYFEYSSGQGGMVSTPTPNPTVFIDSKTCNTSGCFSGPLGSGWIRVTVTAHTCDRDGNEIPGSVATKTASIKVDVIEVKLSRDPQYISAGSTWTQIQESEKQSVIAVTTDPEGYENLINAEIKEVTPEEPTTTDGTLSKNTDIQWTYISFTENKSEKRPADIKTVKITGKIGEKECEIVQIGVFSIFQYLASDVLPYTDRERAWQYAKWKYDIDTSGLNSISYNSNQIVIGLTSALNNCTLGPGAFTRSENFCASILGHENIHGLQTWEEILTSIISWGLGQEHWVEVEAYAWEYNNADQTGLNEDERSEVLAWKNYYNRTGPEPE